jgi:hypothetical protein
LFGGFRGTVEESKVVTQILRLEKMHSEGEIKLNVTRHKCTFRKREIGNISMK